MLGFVSRFGSSKGMVAVPNLLGINSVSAASQLASSGLTIDPLSGLKPTNNSLQNGISLDQLPVAGTLVEYETPILINYGNLIADTIQTSNCEKYGTTTNRPDYCSGTLYVYGDAVTKRRKTITTTNNITGVTTTTYDNNCTDDVVSRGSNYINGQCGYVTPVTTCTATTNYGAYGACNAAYAYLSSGTKARTISGTNSNCTTFSYTDYASCCQAVCQAWSPWSTVPSDTRKEQRARMCQRTNCVREQEREVRCRITYSTTYGTCRSGKKSVTTVATDLCTGVKTTTYGSMPCNAI